MSIIEAPHRIQVAVDCECGTTVEGCDDEELLDELLEHISTAHEAGLRHAPTASMPTRGISAFRAWMDDPE